MADRSGETLPEDRGPGCPIDRRTFLKWIGYGGSLVAVGSLAAACGEDAAAPETAPPATEAPTTAAPTTAAPTTAAPTTVAPTTAAPTTTEAMAAETTTSLTEASTTTVPAAPDTTVAPPPPEPVLPPQKIRLGIDGRIRNFDYHKQFNLTDSWAPSQIFRGLSDLDPVTYRHVPEQAMSWESNFDFTRWTFNIRRGIYFHNGREMTADDVIYSTMRVLNPQTGSVYRPSFVNPGTDESLFRTMETVDSHTISITLHQPNPRLEELFFVGVNAIMPQEAIADINSYPVGTGPFRFKEHIPDVATILEKSPDYWEEDLPILDEIRMIPIPDETSRLAALRAGEVDWIRNPPMVEIPALLADDSITVQVIPSTWVNWFRISPRYPPLDNPRVRRAIAMSINRDAANNRALFGLGTPVYTNVPPLSNVPLNITPPPYDPEGARAILEAEGAIGFDLELIAHDVAHIRKVAESVAADLQTVGINAWVDPMKEGFWANRWSQQDWQMVNSADISVLDPGPRSSFIGEGDVTGYTDPQISAWISEAGAIADVEERGRLYSMAWNKYLNEGATFIAIVAAPYAVAMSNRVKGFEMFPEQQQRWETVWIEA